MTTQDQTVRQDHGEAWRAQSAHWQNQNIPKAVNLRRFRRTERKPLVLTGHGVSLRVDNGALLVRGGRTHYPQKVEEYRFFPGSRDRPSRIVILDGSGAITFDVLDWLSVQDIPLIRIDSQGRVIAMASASGYGASQTKVAEQRKAAETGRSLDIASGLIRRKIQNSIETLTNAIPPSAMREKALIVHTDIAENSCQVASSIGQQSSRPGGQSSLCLLPSVARHPIGMVRNKPPPDPRGLAKCRTKEFEPHEQAGIEQVGEPSRQRHAQLRVRDSRSPSPHWDCR